jgi:hypothetical protein
MSKYLDDLIKSLQAEAREHEASLEQRVPTRRGFPRDTGYLDRLLQRIKSLQELQVNEAKRHRHPLRSVVSAIPRRAAAAKDREVARIPSRTLHSA